MRKYTKELFIEKAIERYGKRYVHDKVVYINSQTKICVICPEHGEFYVRPADYLRGYGCPKCGNLRKNKKLSLSQDEIIERFNEKHGNIYDYSRVNYKNMNTKVDIICKRHGIFKMSPLNHLQGQGCPKCGIIKKSKSQSYDDETLIKRFKEIHKDKYIYDKTELNGNLHNKITITCPIHGDFEQIAQSHLNGHGCKKCQTSKLEEQIKDFLSKEDIDFEQQKTFDWLKHKSHLYLDFYLPEYNIAIECQGEQHYRPINFFGGDETFVKTIKRDDIKQRLCENNGIKIIYFTNKSNCCNNSTITSLKELKETLW